MKRKQSKRQECIVDVWSTEDGNPLFQLCLDDGAFGQQRTAPDACMEGCGFFTDEDALNEFIKENKATIKITTDYRK
jgi:hypothetical protein